MADRLMPFLQYIRNGAQIFGVAIEVKLQDLGRAHLQEAPTLKVTFINGY